MANFNWRCPYCEHDVTITDDRHHAESVISYIESEDGRLAVRAEFTVCPNEECKRTSVYINLAAWDSVRRRDGGYEKQFTDTLGKWRLKPWGNARAFPEYVPAAIRADYEEACAIVDLSPKAAATLGRRAVQGIVRDFWKVKERSLKDEIDAVEKMVGHGVPPETFQSLHAVRELGNIGATPSATSTSLWTLSPARRNCCCRW